MVCWHRCRCRWGSTVGAVLQSTVYAAVFFSIVLCALLAFATERGLLDAPAAVWLGKYAVAPITAAARPSGTALLIEPALAPPDLIAELQEPNPIRAPEASLVPEAAPTDGEPRSDRE